MERGKRQPAATCCGQANGPAASRTRPGPWPEPVRRSDMGMVSKHFPEVLEAANGTACTCPPDINSPDDMCDGCQSDYEQWARQTEEAPAVAGVWESCPEPSADKPF